ncbi:hypothetical protein RFI_02997 [Reticulomyxa filosa]|uniref:Kelch motif family protein n=1 Tax=Reticulomyxa filosa TaxID=46433 RepID=X6P8X3_RETFI|nr:hypothetical protein RFI_02997 [Reticulomyxa filosa]|eukprot:ETO34097.1 hypothetical protein RFI_02997 [Reticulomyxa filosa]
MGNQNKTHFQSLKDLPLPFYLPQYNSNNKDSNQITLLSFGGRKFSTKHTLIMKYISVWNDENNNDNNSNKWIPFTDTYNNQVQIGRFGDDYHGMRAVIGGSNNHLLFITYLLKKISIFNLNTFQFIKHDNLPIKNVMSFHCFVSKPEQEMMKANKKNYEMLLFCKDIGLSIEYDEDDNTFQFYQLPIYYDFRSFDKYAYVCINDSILFFGGYGRKDNTYISKSIHGYLIQRNIWITFKHTLPIPIRGCFGILNEDKKYIHIIGGSNYEDIPLSTHIKTKVNIWKDSSNLDGLMILTKLLSNVSINYSLVFDCLLKNFYLQNT